MRPTLFALLLAMLTFCVGQGCAPPTLETPDSDIDTSQSNIDINQSDIETSQSESLAPNPPSIPTPNFITREDVTDLPTGNATNSKYNGLLYMFISSTLNTCECTLDSVNAEQPCTAFQLLPEVGLYMKVVQDGGSIEFYSLMLDKATGELVDQPQEGRDAAPVKLGSINADGGFVIGAIGEIWTASTDAPNGETIALINGKFEGDFIFLDGIHHATSHQGELVNDCQYTISESWVRVEWP